MKVITILDNSEEMKTQYTVVLTPWDTSEMDNFKEGDRVLKGFSCAIKTLKPLKKYPKGRVDIDPSNQDLRNALKDMYAKYDEVVKK